MLGKLMKHEFHAMARLLLPLYAVLAVFTPLSRFIFLSHSFDGILGAFKEIGIVFYIFLLIAVIVVTFVLLVMRFYKNLLGDEGYLMFTLPASPAQHIHAKLLTGLLIQILSALVIGASLCGALLSAESWSMMQNVFRMFSAQINLLFQGGGPAFWLQVSIAAIISALQYLLMIYLCLAIGQLFNRHRLAASVGAYIALTTAMQAFVSIVTVVIGNFSKVDWENAQSLLPFFFPLIIVFQLIVSIAFYAGTRYLLKNRLNLE